MKELREIYGYSWMKLVQQIGNLLKIHNWDPEINGEFHPENSHSDMWTTSFKISLKCKNVNKKKKLRNNTHIKFCV